MVGDAVNMPEVVYLVGFMGAGKTSVGCRLAHIMGYAFVDLDVEIEKRAGKRVCDIFSHQGEPHFRRLEGEELLRVSSLRRRVIALGGGTFCSTANREIIRRTGTSIWLDAPLEALLARLGRDELRPLLASQPEMEELFAARRLHYAEADIRVDAHGPSVEQVALGIVDSLRKAGHARRLRPEPA